MKKVISYILAVMVLMNTAFAYTSTVTVKGIGLEVNGEEDEEIQIIPDLDKLSGWDGWEVKSGGVTVTNNKFTMPEGSVVIEGKFRESYALTIEMPNFTRTESKEQGESVTIQAITERDGYEFASWTATGITLTEEQTTNATITITMPGNAVTLVANYQNKTYTITYDANGGSGAPTSQTKTHGEAIAISETTPTREGYTFKGWATSNTAATAEYEAGSEYTTNANLSLYAVWEQEITAIIANENVALGAYITYVPSNTTSTVLVADSGYTSDQTYNPSNTTSWRVLKNNNGQLEIISTESIGSLYLKGATGYAKAVYTLNKLCEGYINPIYADSARNPGYVKGNRTEETVDTTVVDGSSQPIIDTAEDAYPLNYGVSGFPYTDTLYDTDQAQINTAGVLNSSEYVWFASRYLTTNSSGGYFSVRIMHGDGSMYGDDLYHVSSSNVLVDANSKGAVVRPIVTLKSGIKITGGEGTSTSPYTISID